MAELGMIHREVDPATGLVDLAAPPEVVAEFDTSAPMVWPEPVGEPDEDARSVYEVHPSTEDDDAMF